MSEGARGDLRESLGTGGTRRAQQLQEGQLWPGTAGRLLGHQREGQTWGASILSGDHGLLFCTSLFSVTVYLGHYSTGRSTASFYSAPRPIQPLSQMCFRDKFSLSRLCCCSKHPSAGIFANLGQIIA